MEQDNRDNLLGKYLSENQGKDSEGWGAKHITLLNWLCIFSYGMLFSAICYAIFYDSTFTVILVSVLAGMLILPAFIVGLSFIRHVSLNQAVDMVVNKMIRLALRYRWLLGTKDYDEYGKDAVYRSSAFDVSNNLNFRIPMIVVNIIVAVLLVYLSVGRIK